MIYDALSISLETHVDSLSNLRYSRHMRGKPFRKGNIPWNKDQIPIVCPVCGKNFVIPKCHIGRRRCCSRSCLAKMQSFQRKDIFGVGDTNPMWKGGISITFYRKIFRSRLSKACENCGSRRFLCVHHLNYDRTDNRLVNLQVVCKSCHQIIHNASASFYRRQPIC